MNSRIQSLRDSLEAYRRTSPESVGLDLRLDFSGIIIRNLRKKGWSQRDLALKAGYKESFISRLLHSNANCTFETAGNVLFALGLRAGLEERAESVQGSICTELASALPLSVYLEDSTYAEESIQSSEEAIEGTAWAFEGQSAVAEA